MMTELIAQPARLFAGRVYTTEDLDQLNTFNSCWQEFTAAGYFDQLDAIATTPNRSYMLVFSPYGAFQYWVGALVPQNAQVPADLEGFALPAATASQVTFPADRVMSDLPVDTTYTKGLERLEKAGFPIPEHIGQTDHPYFIQSYGLADGAVKDVSYLLYTNADQLKGYDEYD